MDIPELLVIPDHEDYAISKCGRVFRVTQPKAGKYRNVPLPFEMKPRVREGSAPVMQMGSGMPVIAIRNLLRWTWGRQLAA